MYNVYRFGTCQFQEWIVETVLFTADGNESVVRAHSVRIRIR